MFMDVVRWLVTTCVIIYNVQLEVLVAFYRCEYTATMVQSQLIPLAVLLVWYTCYSLPLGQGDSCTHLSGSDAKLYEICNILRRCK